MTTKCSMKIPNQNISTSNKSSSFLSVKVIFVRSNDIRSVNIRTQTDSKGADVSWFSWMKQEEKKLGQKFLIDVDAWMDLRTPDQSDNMSDTVSYTDIYRIAKNIVEGPSQNLLESVAQLIATTTLNNHSQISAVRVVVGKPHVAVPGPLDYLGVEIMRYRSTDMPL